MNAKDLIKKYFSIEKKDIDALFLLLKENSSIFTPNDGFIKGRDSIKLFMLNEKEWLNKKEAKVELFNVIDTDERLIMEFQIFYPDHNKKIEVPVVAVIEIESDYIKNIRLYHSNWPITGKHKIINPILEPVDNLEEPAIIIQYMTALKNADKEIMLSLFEENAYVQEPSGLKFRHLGPKGRDEFYSAAFIKGGIPLKHCTATYDGTYFAVEYVFDEWGSKKFEPQAGIAVYKIGKTGKIASVRIYDDASPPA